MVREKSLFTPTITRENTEQLPATSFRSFVLRSFIRAGKKERRKESH